MSALTESGKKTKNAAAQQLIPCPWYSPDWVKAKPVPVRVKAWLRQDTRQLRCRSARNQHAQSLAGYGT